jgi:TonB family protein
VIRIISLLFFTCSACFAQEAAIEFYSADDRKTDEASSVYYKVGIKKGNVFVDSISTFYTRSNAVRSVESRLTEGKIHLVKYYENGKKKEEGFIMYGGRVGLYKGFYESEENHYVFEYPEKFDPNTDPVEFRIINYWDSLGNQLVKDGDGYCRCFFEWGGTWFAEAGRISKGYRTGRWNGMIGKKIAYDEEYQLGKLKIGLRTIDSLKVTYRKTSEPPSYPGDLPAIAKFMQKNLRYPAEARIAGYEGIVYVGFLVRSNGKLEDLEVLNEIPKSLAIEALRVVGSMDRWNPGKVKGAPADMRFALPVKFKLER